MARRKMNPQGSMERTARPALPPSPRMAGLRKPERDSAYRSHRLRSSRDSVNRRAWLLAVAAFMALSLAPAAHAQGVRYDNILLNTQGTPISGASVAVCTIAANTSVQPCNPLVQIYSDRALTVPQANPFTTALGNYGFYAAPGTYVVQLYGGSLTTKVYTVTLPCDPSASSGCGTAGGLSTSSAVSTGTLSVTGNISVTGTVSSSAGTAPGVSGTPATGDCANWASATSLGDAGAACGAGGAGAALKPALTDAIQFVSANGSDSNDGLSWGTAVKTLYQAWLNLYATGGTFGAGSPGGGTIYVGAKASCGGPVTNQGLWIMGPGDPNSLGFSNAAVTITGMSRSANVVTVTLAVSLPTYYATGAAITVTGASDSSFNGTFTIASASGSQFTYSQTGGNGSATSAWIVPKGWVYEMGVRVVGIGTQAYSGNQPGIPVVSTTCGGASTSLPGLWFSGTNVPMHFENLIFGGYFPLNAAKTNSNGTSPGNGATTVSFRNVDFSATQVAGSGPAAWLSQNDFWFWFDRCVFTGSANGTAGSEQRQAVVMDGQNGLAGMGLIFFKNVQLNAGGLYFFAASTQNGNSLYVDGLVTEAQNDGSAAVTVFDPGLSTPSDIRNVTVSDESGGGFAGYGVVVEPSTGNSFVKGLGLLSSETIVENVGKVSGPMVNLGGNLGPLRPSVSGQSGFYNGHVYGQQDSARRQFAWVTPRLAATTDGTRTSIPSTWTHSAGITVTTTTGPDGASDAGDVTTTNGGQQQVEFYDKTGITLAAGDYLIQGVWVQSVGANTYAGEPIPGSNVTSCAGFVLQPLGGNYNAALGDGAWEWVWSAVKVTTGQTNCEPIFNGYLDSTHETKFYGPVFLHIAAGTMTDGEAAELAANLESYPTYCPAGETCSFPGRAIGFDPTSSGFLATLTQAAPSANQTYTLPASGGTFALVLTGSVSGSTTSLAANSCGDTATATVTGATTSMTVGASPQSWAATTGLTWDAWVSAANTVTLRYCNVTAGSVTPPATTFNIRVIQ
jgi:hypothetical protein